mgnify:CR=1 FL=1|tara:strand:- start:4217 stop:4693 length:477 start_codon:yes stop_codon:yes gene_type:complete
MINQHIFKVSTNWSKKEGESTTSPRTYSRNHTIKIKGRAEVLKISAAKAFKGDDTLHNPEDLLLSAVSSCHMMSYFYVCSQNGVEVLSYTDNAQAFLEVDKNGKGQIAKVELYPEVIVSKPEMIEVAETLHQKANDLCFIANSCNFPISHSATVNCSE